MRVVLGVAVRSSEEVFVISAERRDSVKSPTVLIQPSSARKEISTSVKPFVISKSLVYEAYCLVKANLYKLRNRMSSESYIPPAVKAVAIQKKSGGERILGIPTVADRIAQMVVKFEFELVVEPHFLPDCLGSTY